MHLTLAQLAELTKKLEAAIRGRQGCAAPRGPDRFVPKPGYKGRHRVGHAYGDGTTLVQQDHQIGIVVPGGTHGTAFLGIDPASGQIVCTACPAGPAA